MLEARFSETAMPAMICVFGSVYPSHMRLAGFNASLVINFLLWCKHHAVVDKGHPLCFLFHAVLDSKHTYEMLISRGAQNQSCKEFCARSGEFSKVV